MLDRSLACTRVAGGLMHVPSLGLGAVAAIALVAGDLFYGGLRITESLRLLNDNLGDFARSMLNLSLLQRLWRRPKLPLGNEE